MAKGDNVKQLEEDLQKVLQDVSEQNPPVLYVHDVQDEEGMSLLKLDVSTLLTEEMGVSIVFPLDMFDVMKARALAFGVILERRYA